MIPWTDLFQFAFKEYENQNPYHVKKDNNFDGNNGFFKKLKIH